MKIIVLVENNKVELDCELSETLNNIKKTVELRLNTSLEGYKFKIFVNTIDNMYLTLSSCLEYFNIQNIQACLIRAFKKDVGGGGRFGLEFNSMVNSVQRDYHNNATEQNIIVKGLNVDSICQNSSCKFYNKKVTVQLGIGTFNMVDLCFSEKYKCCVCQQKPQDIFQNPIMNDCKYEISGRYLPDGKKNYEIFKKSGQIAGKYIVFEDSQNSKRLWHSLSVKTERL
ncbi:hypothetical protein ABPG74_011628 [Tetrahymena malaccensis]